MGSACQAASASRLLPTEKQSSDGDQGHDQDGNKGIAATRSVRSNAQVGSIIRASFFCPSVFLWASVGLDHVAEYGVK
jgi:hypothetical protein